MTKFFYILGLVLFLSSCEKEEVEDYSINFPAAYIVNSENSVSILNLNTLKIDTTIRFLNDVSTFSHHIYKSADNTLLAIATPKYDFSNGHGALHTLSPKGGITILKAKTCKMVSSFEVPFANQNAILSKDGKEVWTALFSHSGALLIYNSTTGEKIKEISLDSDPSEVVFSKDYQYAFVACGESSFVTAISTETKEVVKKLKVDLFPTNVWSGNDGMIYVENQNFPSINVIDPSKLAAIEAIDTPFSPGNSCFNTDFNELWVCKSGTNNLATYSKQHGSWLANRDIFAEEGVHAIQFFDSGKKAIVVNQQSNSISIFDVQTKNLIKNLAVGKKPNGVVVIE